MLARAAAAAEIELVDHRIKGLNISRFDKYGQGYALDDCGHLANIVASWILVSYWRRPNSRCFGDRRDFGGNKARHRSRSVGLRFRLDEDSDDCKQAGDSAQSSKAKAALSAGIKGKRR